MKISNGMLSIKDMADLVGVCPDTLRNWCLWWESYPEGSKPKGVVFPNDFNNGRRRKNAKKEV